MIVVSDTSPLTALLTVGAADTLLKLFSEVISRAWCLGQPCDGSAMLPLSHKHAYEQPLDL